MDVFSCLSSDCGILRVLRFSRGGKITLRRVGLFPARLFGTGVFCFVTVTCATYVFVDYQLKIQQAELDYQVTIAGCPR